MNARESPACMCWYVGAWALVTLSSFAFSSQSQIISHIITTRHTSALHPCPVPPSAKAKQRGTVWADLPHCLAATKTSVTWHGASMWIVTATDVVDKVGVHGQGLVEWKGVLVKLGLKNGTAGV